MDLVEKECGGARLRWMGPSGRSDQDPNPFGIPTLFGGFSSCGAA